MRVLLTLSLLFLLNDTIVAQHNLVAVLKDSLTDELLIGATAMIEGTENGASADLNGQLEIKNISSGIHTVIFSLTGYEKSVRQISFPLQETIIVYLSPLAGELGEVIIEGTRSNKSIADNPTRVEVLTEEIDEASTMDPSKIAHLITHSTGIQVQQTSATSNTANVRIQGLDGRYTQILKDGFPLYGGFSGSLSIMQIPPLDLRQVEYIKGSSSTLYGGGAISGLINLISKEPTKEETLLHLNGSQIGAFDVNAFVSRKTGNVGFTLLGQRNTSTYFDADNDGFSDCPKLTKYNLNPRLFLQVTDNTKLTLGGTFTDETRQGGDTKLMQQEFSDSLHFYKEVNAVKRSTTQLKLDHKIDETHSVTVRNSFNIFQRALTVVPSPAQQEYRFAGKQLSSFSEAALTYNRNENVLVTGLNYYSDNFKEDSLQSPILRNESYRTLGGFANYTATITKRFLVEAGFRGDWVSDEKFFALPRVSALFKWTDRISTRIGGGMGYRNPTIFNQEAEILGYQNVLPVDKKRVSAEQSYGGNVDVGYKAPLGEHFFITVNQLFFYTYLDRPLILVETAESSGTYQYINANGYTQSYGGETFFKFGFYDFVLFVGYTYTNATNHFNDSVSTLTLTPKHSIKGDLLYALPNKWRIGLDYEFKSSQQLSNGQSTNAYWTFGAVVEYTWKNFTLFGNVENYTNVRQTKFESLRSAPYETPQFTEVWAPLDGIVFNTGIKIRL